MEIISILVFLGVMVLITTGKIDSTLSALIGAAVILLTKVLSFDEAIKYVDFDTIGVLVGMMLFIAVLKQSGMFEYIAVKAAKMVNADPWKIMIIFVIITAVLSSDDCYCKNARGESSTIPFNAYLLIKCGRYSYFDR